MMTEVIIEQQSENNEDKFKEARYISDVITIESPDFQSHLRKNYNCSNGYPKELTDNMYVYGRILPENYKKWAEIENRKEFVKNLRKKIEIIAKRWNNERGECEIELNALVCSDFTKKALQDWVLEEVKKLKKNVSEIKEKPKKTGNWESLTCIDSFFIYEGSERIYDITINGKKIRLEGKEIMDYNVFRLKYFETFGTMLPTFRGIMEFWSSLITNWNENYGKIVQGKTEDISESEEAKQLIIDYINNCSIVDGYVIKEGIITLREDFIFVPTKIIKKLLKRESMTISLRKLAYLLDNYIASGSIPIKIENRSERFWKFYSAKFDINKKNKLELQDE